MQNLQSKSFPLFIGVFLTFMGTLFVFILPIYQGPDEPIHYGTVQYKAEPQEKTWPIQERKIIHSGQDIREFNLSEETVLGGKLNQFDELKWQEENTQNFSLHTTTHPDEQTFNQTQLKRYIDTYPHNASGTKSVYYTLASLIEKNVPELTFNERFFLTRFFSLALYLGIVVLTYLVTYNLFTSFLQRALFTLLVGLEPMLLATGTIVNIDIALVFSFTLFFLTSIRVLTKPNFINHAFLLLSFILAFYSKGPAICLAPVMGVIYLLLLKNYFHWSTKKTLSLLLLSAILVVITFFVAIPHSYTTSIFRLGTSSQFASVSDSLLSYTQKTLSFDDLFHSHTSYWGNFGWLDTEISKTLLIFIWFLEYLAYTGLIFFLLSKKTLTYLPSKKIIYLSLGIILSLQLAIRFYDWRTFDITKQILIGTPGRYFLPTILPHFVILVTGFGFLFTTNRAQFTLLLKTLSLGMLLLSMYAVFNVIIPRYYL